MKIQQEQIAANTKEKQDERDLEIYKIDANNAAKILIEELKQGNASKKLNLDEKTSSADIMLKIKELQQEMTLQREEMKIKKAQINAKKVG